MFEVLLSALMEMYKGVYSLTGGDMVRTPFGKLEGNAYSGEGSILSWLAVYLSIPIVLIGGMTYLPWNWLSLIALLLIIFMMIYDVRILEMLFRNYKKSSYYLATGVKRSKIWFDKGLQGEFEAYILSRQLKIPHRILYNVCVPMPNGNFQEVDAVIITRNMVYVLECKNRGGVFEGEYDEEDWVQHIGNQTHPCKNIYIQNQKHIMAIERLLLDKGIIENGQSVCMNVILKAGDMRLPQSDKFPMDCMFGGKGFVIKCIRKFDRGEMEGIEAGEDESMMNLIYETLLPYALYNQQEREALMEIRERRSKASKEFSTGRFVTRYYENGIPDVTDYGEPVYIRSNNIYTQIQVTDGVKSFWQTRTDIPEQYLGRQ